MDFLFVESPAFSEKVDSFLNEDEQDRLRFLLAVNPLSGNPSRPNENVLEIFFFHCYVSYVIDSEGIRIHLINIEAEPMPIPTPAERNTLADIKGAKILNIKKLLGRE